MSGSDDQNTECPLCMEPLELDDINFFPCTCGYQICRFCWHRIRTDENGLCPACRKQYSEDPADFKPLTPEELQRIKNEKRQKDQQRKQKISDNRKHLANVRVVQKNLVFVVGLSQRLAEVDVLKRNEYFGKFGKLHKVVINHSTSYAGSQGPSASAYVTYCRVEDALRAIQAVNNIHVDGRTLKASLGTTKYCSHFLKGQLCPKPDCMYLHETGDEAASFTKEEMQMGKHQEYEKKLHEQLFSTARRPNNSPALAVQPVKSQPVSSNSVPVNGVSSVGAVKSASETTKSGGRTKGQNKKDANNKNNNQKKPATGDEGKRANKSKSAGENSKNNSSGNSKSRGSAKQANNSAAKCPVQPSVSVPTSEANDLSRNTVQKVPDTSSGLPGSTEGHSKEIASAAQPLPQPVTPLSSSTPSSMYSTASSVSVGQSSQTSSGTESPAQCLKNLDLPSSSSSSAVSSLSSSADVIPPFYGVRNASSPSVASNTVLPPNENMTNEWMHSLPDSELSTTGNLETHSATDWQAAFGFTSTQTKDDDLGFDPWDESSKALADLMEKEMHHNIGGPSQAVLQSFPNRSNFMPPYGRVDPNVHPLRPMALRSQHPPNMHGQQSVGRRFGAPPGFAPSHVSNLYGMSRPISTAQHHQMQPQQQQPTMSSLVNGPTTFHNHHGNHMQQQQQHQQILHHNHHHPQQQQQHHVNHHHPYYGDPYTQHMTKTGNLARESQSKNPDSLKELQDNFRALFPNVNITFGTPNGMSRQRVTQQKGWSPANNMGDNSWVSQDPAVVSAGNITTVRSDSPPHWMKSLQQLTEVELPYNNHHVPVNHYSYRNPQWSNSTHIPPPGFANSIVPSQKPAETQKIMDNF